MTKEKRNHAQRSCETLNGKNEKSTCKEYRNPLEMKHNVKQRKKRMDHGKEIYKPKNQTVKMLKGVLENVLIGYPSDDN